MSWIAGILEIIAKWLVGEKKKVGWLVHMASGVLWIIIAIQNPKIAGGLLIICIPSIFINIRNYFKWKKDENTLST